MVWSECRTTGASPGPRGYHTATSIDNARILVFGGSDGQECFSDLHILDTGIYALFICYCDNNNLPISHVTPFDKLPMPGQRSKSSIRSLAWHTQHVWWVPCSLYSVAMMGVTTQTS